MIKDLQLCGVGVTKDPTQLAGRAERGRGGVKKWPQIVAKCHSNQIKKSLFVFAEKSTNK